MGFVAMSCSTEKKTGKQVEAEVSKDTTHILVWADEFDYEGAPDSSKWGYHLGDGCPNLCGFGNNELQYYSDRPENVKVEDGKLIITALKDSFETRDYSSTKLITKGKGDFKYGRILVKAKLPKGVGTWPAIWMLPTLDRGLNWPMDGEIDIMEHVGYDQNKIHGTIHTKVYNHVVGTQKSGTVRVENASETFHEYGIEWTPTYIDWSVDGTSYYKLPNDFESTEEWPFDLTPFYIILNLAVGGNWGGAQGVDDSVWPQTLEVEYVRVFQREHY